MFFEELVEQHRVHRFIAHGVGFALLVAQPPGRDSPFPLPLLPGQTADVLRIKLFFVAEGDWFEREDRFARLVHRFDFVLEPRRGGPCPS